MINTLFETKHASGLYNVVIKFHTPHLITSKTYSRLSAPTEFWYSIKDTYWQVRVQILGFGLDILKQKNIK